MLALKRSAITHACRMEIAKKYRLATFCICSNRFLSTKFHAVYLLVRTAFETKREFSWQGCECRKTTDLVLCSSPCCDLLNFSSIAQIQRSSPSVAFPNMRTTRKTQRKRGSASKNLIVSETVKIRRGERCLQLSLERKRMYVYFLF